MRNKTLKIFLLLLFVYFAFSISAIAAAEPATEAEELIGTVGISHDGSPQYGETIVADVSGITNNTGTLSYQWLRGGAAVSGADSSTYTLSQDDIGKSISVEVASSSQSGSLISNSIAVAKADREAPPAPTILSASSRNVTLSVTSGCEYKAGSGSFSANNAFNGLLYDTEYVFYQRYAETAVYNASPASTGLAYRTGYLLISNTSYNISGLSSGDGVYLSGSVTLSGSQNIRAVCSAGTKLTFQNASINLSSAAGACAVEFESSGQLVLSGTNSVVSGSGRAGVECAGSLSIYGTGSLYAKGGSGGAGIGGGNGEQGGNISITGGLIFASGSGGYDIGGGSSSSGNGTLGISGSSALFLRSNLAPAASTSTHALYTDETVESGAAYGYILPSAWTNGSSAYAYIDYCTVSFNTNGAGSIPSQNAGKMSSLTLPADPQKSGFYFGGWYKDSSLTDYFDSSSDKVYSDMTLYARWNVKVNVSANAGGTVNPVGDIYTEAGRNLIIECVPQEKFIVGSVTSEKGYVIVNNGDDTYTIKNIGADDKIKVVFENRYISGTVTINHDGTPACMETVSADVTKAENVKGTITYQWTRDGNNISGANDATYILAREDVGHSVGVNVTSSEREGAISDTIAMKVEKATKAAPRPPEVIAKTTDSITLEIVEGCEYKMGDGKWQDSNEFTGLEPETEYVFYQRYAESYTHKASSQSFALKVYTEGFNVKEIEIYKDSVHMQKGDILSIEDLIEYIIYPENAQNKKVYWTSSNEKTAVIDSESGKITAVGYGKSIITITSEDEKNGIISDICELTVYDEYSDTENSYKGTLRGRLTDSDGMAVSGYTIVLYSSPLSRLTDENGEFSFENIPYTRHTMIVENELGEETGRFDIVWAAGEESHALADESTNIISIIYSEDTLTVSIPVEIESTGGDIAIASGEEISFLLKEPEQTSSGKKVYMIVLMGIIAACIIGVGYILYIGRIRNKEEVGFTYEQPLIEEGSEPNPKVQDKE
ncbi:MAG: InlB B-repeat-containing protein [Clostridia bacterium]|nr:InlB B-repeat-containing protein [Clostridia bacterium]